MTFFSPVATAKFSKFSGILSAAFSQYHLLGFAICVYIYIYNFQILFPHRFLQNIDYLSVCYTVDPCCLPTYI